MDKIVLHKMNSKPIGKGGGCIYVSVAINEQLDSLADETGIAKQRITDYLHGLLIYLHLADGLKEADLRSIKIGKAVCTGQ